ncbi:Tetratricopeptide TPR_2 repeat protein [Methanocaldococcus infernus ME]|uniref:Tetratricopeptide TPR_2 repeat protein n=1 Tax=Methanocaldococcus infernus (strain DSM 11812 / JCM 15783 / ME) TaxID=573063 RepID=D5VT88_METIM|nr:tetratricopeptide repeat protein [Methanocaldococcus infernus]ADG13791.1 Tetratricopeptide TPR_2 repeat protein [Methanocaldococcus infernus ME]
METPETPRVKVLEAVSYALRAYRAMFEGNLYKALYYCDESLRLQSDFLIPLFLKGLILTSLGKVDEAIEVFNTLVRLGDKNPITYLFLGQLYGIKGSCSDALKNYKKALNIEDNFPSAQFLKLLCLESLGKYEELLEEYDKVLRVAPNLKILYVKKADILRKLGKYYEALECINKALEKDPNDINALYLKGVLLKRMNKFEEAYQVFKKLIDELNVKWLDALRHLASICLTIGEFKEAIKYAEEGLKIAGEDPTFLYYIGKAYERLKEYERAKEYLNRCIEKKPSYVKALLSLAKIHEEEGNYEKAADLYVKSQLYMDKHVKRDLD